MFMATNNDLPQNDDLYPVLYRAVHDALWNVIGTVIWALVLVAMFLFGLQIVAFGLFASAPPQQSLASIVVLIAGGVLVVGSAIRLLQLFDILPSLR